MILPKLTLAALAISLVPAHAMSGPVGQACLRSDRPAATAALCRCIDQVAEQTLSRRDQGQAAGFFRNPDRAQLVRMHKSPSANAFWARYKNFANMSARYCG